MKRRNLLKNFIASFFLSTTLVCLSSSSAALVYAAETEEVPLADGVEAIEMTNENEVVPVEEVEGEEAVDEEETPQKTDWGKNTLATQAEVFIEGSGSGGAKEDDPKSVASELVDAPPIVPEGGTADNNIFGVAGMYYVTVPKHMSFRKMSNGDYESVETSRYTINSGLDSSYRLSVKVSGVNIDDTVQLSDEKNTVHRKVEVSTMAYDVWNYRPDGTRLTVNGADAMGYGKELVLEGPGKLFAKCRLSKFGDDNIQAGTWSGAILFTVTCTPDPEEKASEAEDEASNDIDSSEADEGATASSNEEETGGSTDQDAASMASQAAEAAEAIGNDVLEPSVPEGSISNEESSVGEPAKPIETVDTTDTTETAESAQSDESLEEADVESTNNDLEIMDDGALVDVSQMTAEPQVDTGEGTDFTDE